LALCGRAIVNKAVGQLVIYFGSAAACRLAQLDTSRKYKTSKSSPESVRLICGSLFERVVAGAR